MKIFFDGGCRPAPVGMELAVVIAGEALFQRELGPGSAMDAEWLALIAALAVAIQRGVKDPLLLGDAAAVIAQASGKVRCPPRHAHHRDAFLAMPRPPGRLRLRYVKRQQNLAGIALAAHHGVSRSISASRRID